MVPDNLTVIAKVIPIDKKGLYTSIGNDCPISLLSIFNLILEKLIFKRLMKFIETQNILYTKQFGFSLLKLLCQSQVRCKKPLMKAPIRGIFLDFSKAFATVNHNILIMKLDHHDFREIVKKWFCFNLNEWKQFVSIGKTMSDYKQIPYEVPQRISTKTTSFLTLY